MRRSNTRVEGRWRGAFAAGLALVWMLASPVAAQWLHVPLASTPRTPDGKPDLAAPAPRAPDGKPDLSGIWQRPRGVQPGSGGRDGIATGVEVLFQPWAEALYKARKTTARARRANGACPTASRRPSRCPNRSRSSRVPASS